MNTEQEFQEGVRRAEELQRRKNHLAILEPKYKPMLSTQIPENCNSVVDAIFYWYWRKYLEKRKDIKNYSSQVRILREQKLIPPSQEFFLLTEIDKYEEKLWNLGIEVLTSHKYSTLVGNQNIVNNVESWVNSLFELDTIMNRLTQVMELTINDIRNNVQRRDLICKDEFTNTKVCEPTACEIYKPFFSPAVCRSKKR